MPKLNAQNCCLYVPVNIHIYEKIQQFLSSIKKRCTHKEIGSFFLPDGVYFSHKMYGSNFNKQHSETVMVGNYQNADRS